jgi:polyhydroxybutyrate depolymerase
VKKILSLSGGLLLAILSYSQMVTDSLLIDGHYRTFHFNIPVAANNASLVFILHGSGGKGLDMVKATAKLEARSATDKIIIVYPDGYKNYWNECRKAATSAANLENINEQTFFTAMIAYFKTKHSINTKHVYAAGVSGGGHMAYKLAITMPDKIKAITAIIANMPDNSNMDCDESKKPIPVMIVNGTADPTNPYNGGEVKNATVTLGTVRSTDQSFHYWATIDGYTGEPVKTDLPDTDPSDGKTIEKYTYKQKGKPEVTLLKVINGKHDLPNDIDVFLEAWWFFQRNAN